MKLGSIVGLIIAAILIIAGIIMCIVGSSSAKSEGRELLMQIDGSGTHYVQEVSSETTKISLDCESAKIIINGNAESSYIEFTNFNPNKYSVSATANVISFSESADISSLLDLGDFGFSFKGLRYFLDPRNDDFDELEKTIVVNLSADSKLKIIDIKAENADVTAKSFTVSGDIILNVKTGTVSLDSSSASSTLSIAGDDLKTSINGCTGKTLRYSARKSELSANGCDFTNSEIASEEGRIDVISEVTLDDRHIALTSESGGILFNTKPVASPFNYEPPVGEDGEEKKASFKITAKSASVNIQFPTQIVTDPATPTVNVTP